jgi:hypothetical protein
MKITLLTLISRTAKNALKKIDEKFGGKKYEVSSFGGKKYEVSSFGEKNEVSSFGGKKIRRKQ